MSLRIPHVSLIYAKSTNDIMGKGGKLPWVSPQDLAFFKAKTLGHIVVMGRKTFESLQNKPLAGRTNVVITRQKDFVAEGALVVGNLYDAVTEGRKTAPEAQVFIIGGKALLEEGAKIAYDAFVSYISVQVEYDHTCVCAPDSEPLQTAKINEGIQLHVDDGTDPSAVVCHYHF